MGGKDGGVDSFFHCHAGTVGIIEVGDGASHFQNAVIGAGAHVKPLHGITEPRHALVVKSGIVSEKPRIHLSVAMHVSLGIESEGLQRSSLYDSLADDGALLPCLHRRQLLKWHRHYLHLKVDAVHKRARDAAQIAAHLSRHTCTFLGGMVIVAAGAWIHRGDKHEPCGIIDRISCARHAYHPVFERLAHHLQNGARKFGKFVEKKHSVVGK